MILLLNEFDEQLAIFTVRRRAASLKLWKVSFQYLRTSFYAALVNLGSTINVLMQMHILLTKTFIW